MKTMSRFFIFAFALSVFLPAAVRADSLRGNYYMVVFGYQGAGNRAVDSHTFAAFIDGDALAAGATSNLPTISWLPATGIVRPIRREPGRNFTLTQTLQIARSRGYQVRAFGPYQITRELYGAALNRIAYLNSGALWYKMINGPFSAGAINCIHAVSDIGGELNTGTEWGFPASASVVTHLSRWIYNYPDLNRDVAARIGLDQMVSPF